MGREIFFGREIMLFAPCEIFCFAESEMKSIPSRPQAFHMAQPYFTSEGHFTNPKGIYFVKKKKQMRAHLLFLFWSG